MWRERRRQSRSATTSQEPMTCAACLNNPNDNFMQLILGQVITNNGRRTPQNRQRVFRISQALFNEPSNFTVDNLPGYSDCLAQFKKTIATVNSNDIVEIFRIRAKAYIAFHLGRQVPNDVII